MDFNTQFTNVEPNIQEENHEFNVVNESRNLEVESDSNNSYELGNTRLANPATKENSSENYFFELYKSMKFTSHQSKRRDELLNEQKRLRSKLQDSSRSITLDDEDFENVEAMEVGSRNINRNKRKPYKGLMMLSEWLVDVPEDLDVNWFAKLCPTGHHCLVVASKYTTKSYSRFGSYVATFKSVLPGSRPGESNKMTILDCIWNSKLKRMYVLDVLMWNGLDVMHYDTEFRFFWLQSKLNDIEELGMETSNNKYVFSYVPHHVCDFSIIKELFCDMHEPPVDGILFYHREGSYTSGDTPLVGWLKPFMLPEILKIPVSPEYMEMKPDKYVNLTQHIAYAKNKREIRNNGKERNKMETEEFEQDTSPIT